MAALVAGFDDASWEALASKGLLRRARKDLEKGLQIEVVGDAADALQFNVALFLVSMPLSGPAGASCSCSAPGVCQHILAVGLYLQTRGGGVGAERGGPTADSIREEIRLLTPEHLKAWAGAVDYRAGLTLLERNSLPSVIAFAETVIIRLMPSSLETRFVPGGGLDGMILPPGQVRRAAVAAILALRKSLGLEIPRAAAQQALVELSGTPRTKKEILDSACSVLEDAVAVGLSHVSLVLAERLVTLAVSAQGAQLPRVSLALKTVSDEVKSILRREARADEARLLIVIARVYALMEAIRSAGENPDSEFAGAQRGQYLEVPELELSGVGAYTWQTGSGYRGLTVLFWSKQTKEFLSWSEARPESQQFDPRQRFFADGPWEGAQSPQQVAVSTLKLRNARRTAHGRLSSSTKTSALVLTRTAPLALEFGNRRFTSWSVLRRYVCEKLPLGLREPNPLDLIGVLEPRAFGARAFDSITQTFAWEVFDEVDQALTLSLPFRDWSKEAIRILEELSPTRGQRWQIVVRLAQRDDLLLVEPVSILRPDAPEGPVFHLSFDTLAQATAVPTVRGATAPEPEEALASEYAMQSVAEDDAEIDRVFVPTRTCLYRVITELNRHLEAIAETGVQNGLAAHRDWFAQSHREVHSFGLTTLARALDSLSSQLSVSPGVLLKTRFLTNLHSQAAAHLE